MSRRVVVWAGWAAVGAVLLPIAVAAVRAVRDGWLPIGDNAYFALRARDVLTEHHPLLGTWTSASLSLGIDVNNPGPLLFDLYAVPARISGGAGLATGVALINAACIVGIALVARRLGGSRLLLAAMVPTAALVWLMGSELLFDPWQPHSLLLPSLLALFLAWAVAAGDAAMLPWLAGVGSLVVQTHVSYGYLVVALWGAAAVAVILDARRRSRSPDAPQATDAAARWPRRWLWWTGGVLAVCWVQPVIEQFTGDGRGNLGRLAGSVDDGGGVGPSVGIRLAASVLASPARWTRAAFRDAFVRDPLRPTRAIPDLLPVAVAVAAIFAIAVALAAAIVVAHRRGDRTAAAAPAVSAVVLAAGLVTASSTPSGFFGVTAHQVRWLWPVALFVVFSVVVVAARTATGRLALAAFGVVLAAVAVFAIIALPRSAPAGGPALDAYAIDVVRELRPQLAALVGRGPVQFEPGIPRFAEPYSTPVLDCLDELDVEVRVTEHGALRQIGTSRRADGDEALMVTLREGTPALEAMPGAERIAFASTLSADDRQELERLARDVGELVEEGRIHLTPRGTEAASAGVLMPAPGPDGYRDADQLVETGLLVGMLENAAVEPEPADAELVERWAELRRRLDRETVAVFAIPLDEDADDG